MIVKNMEIQRISVISAAMSISVRGRVSFIFFLTALKKVIGRNAKNKGETFPIL